MKNKKSMLALGLVALVLVLGVGYAVVSSVGLTFTGSATVGDASLKVDIQKVEDEKPEGVIVEHSLTKCSNTDTFTITNMKLNDTVVMTYTIDNHETDVAAKIKETSAITNSNPTYFSVNYVVNEPVPAEGTSTVVVTVKMVKTPVTTEQGTASFTLNVLASPVAE